MKRYTDIHMHIMPGVDDGSENLDMSMKMLAMARGEGIRTIFATPHYDTGSDYINTFESVDQQYNMLREKANIEFPDIRIYRGNEIYYEDRCIANWIEKALASMDGLF